MRTGIAELMSILSFSLQSDTTERITAWERETATYERDSGKTLDDENQDWDSFAQIARVAVEKTHLLMRVDTLKNGQISEAKWLLFLVRLPLLSHSRHRWTLEHWARGNQERVVRDRKELAIVTTRLSKPVSRCGRTDHTSANCPHSDITRRKCGKVGHLASVCRSSGTPQPKAKGDQKGKGGGKGANAAKTC